MQSIPGNVQDQFLDAVMCELEQGSTFWEICKANFTTSQSRNISGTMRLWCEWKHKNFREKQIKGFVHLTKDAFMWGFTSKCSTIKYGLRDIQLMKLMRGMKLTI